jgi:hypothetical protein
VDLPTGEPDPIMRLNRISFEMAQHSAGGGMVGAQNAGRADRFRPAHAACHGCARWPATSSRRVANVVVTNVPGPQTPLYVAGAELLAAYPVLPLVKDMALSIGLTSYNGGVFFGLNADRDAMDDIDVLTACMSEALDELLDTTRQSAYPRKTRAEGTSVSRALLRDRTFIVRMKTNRRHDAIMSRRVRGPPPRGLVLGGGGILGCGVDGRSALKALEDDPRLRSLAPRTTSSEPPPAQC